MKKLKSLSLVLMMALMSCHQRPPAQAVIIHDRSNSTAATTSSVIGVAGQALSLPGLGHGSHLTIITTGDAATDMEPVLVGTFAIPKPRKVMERGTIITEKKEFIEQIKKSLADISNNTTRSPIYIAVVRGVQQLRAQGCVAGQDKSRCVLTVITDGDETEQKDIRKAMLKVEGEFKPAKSIVIDNSGLTIKFCDLATVTDKRTDLDAARMQAVWQAIFTEPVLFQPFCPRTEEE